jgi:hypothetical protein
VELPVALASQRETAAESAWNPPRHWISVDCRWLGRNGFNVRGWLSVYAIPGGFTVANDPAAVLSVLPQDGVSLFGREEASLPSDEVLEAYLLPEEIRTLKAWEGAAEYFKQAALDCPLFRTDLVAVLGGWHVGWPDGPPELPRLRELNQRINRAGGPGCLSAAEKFRCEPYQLVLWTLRDSEPWVEVWSDGEGELHAVRRIT